MRAWEDGELGAERLIPRVLAIYSFITIICVSVERPR